MNRFKKAWLALTGKLEPEVVEVEVGIEPATVYRIDVESYGVSSMFHDGTHALWKSAFPTCEAAFAAIAGRDYFHVEEIKTLRVGRRYFPEGAELKVGKPKREKGKRAK